MTWRPCSDTVREWIRDVGFPIFVAVLLLALLLWERREHQAAVIERLDRIKAEQEATTETVRELVRRIR